MVKPFVPRSRLSELQPCQMFRCVGAGGLCAYFGPEQVLGYMSAGRQVIGARMPTRIRRP